MSARLSWQIGKPPLLARDLAIGWIAKGRRNRTAATPPLACGISLELRAGSFAALVGPNGAGKSTLLRTLGGQQRPIAGLVELGGANARRLGAQERAMTAACVFTDRFDAGYFSVYDIVAFGRYPYTDARNRLSPEDREAVWGALGAVGLKGFAARRFSELSDGERQKALIARAIAQDCPLLILDEPTAFLDAPARIEVFHLGIRLAREGKAVVMSTHDLDHALRYADQVWLLDRERRFVAGPPEALALSGALGRAFDGPGLRFDVSSGLFRAVDRSEPSGLSIAGGPEPESSWTMRLAERLGFAPLPAGSVSIEGAALPLVEIRKDGEAGTRWILRTGGETSSFGGIDALALALTALRGRRTAP